jgi:hypothetical protein
MNCKKTLFFFSVLLLSAISFSGWAQPYVRVEELNQSVDLQNWSSDAVDASYWFNPTIKLYTDSACTVPYVTSTDLDVTIEQFYYDGSFPSSNNVVTGTASFTVTVPSGNSSFSVFGDSNLGDSYRLSVYQIHYDYSNSISFINSSFMSFSVAPGGGYEFLPSVVRSYDDQVVYTGGYPSSVTYRVYEP